MKRSVRSQLLALARRGAIAPDQLEEAASMVGVIPNGQAWRQFIERLLLWIGTMSITLSVLFFVAFNWTEIGRFAKFGLVEILVVLAIGIYWQWGHQRLIGQLSLLAASILLGILLALVGQTYQTGADPWQLFFYWAVLILPWSFIGRSSVIWVLWFALLQVAISLYDTAVFGWDNDLLWVRFAVSTLVLIGWEYWARASTWMTNRWAPRIFALVGGVTITSLVVENIFDGRLLSPSMIVWLLCVPSIAWLYQRFVKDLFVLAGLCLSCMAVVTVFVGYWAVADSIGLAFYSLSAVVMLSGYVSIVWLKHVQRGWKNA